MNRRGHCGTQEQNKAHQARSANMKEEFKETLYQLSPGALALVSRVHYRLHIQRSRWNFIRRPTDPHRVDVLKDPLFIKIRKRVMEGTAYDTARVAQIFLQVRESVDGVMFDIGTHQGGIALMLSMMHPGRQVYACDTFKGIQGLSRLHGERLAAAFLDACSSWRAKRRLVGG